VTAVAHTTEEKPNAALERLKSEAGGLLSALSDRAMSSMSGKVGDLTGRLTDFAEGGGGPGLKAAITGVRGMAEGKSPARSMMGAAFSGVKEKVSGMFGRGKGKDRGKKKLKLTNIVESIDVGVPLRLAYDQWNQFSDFPTFMKKVDSAERTKEAEKLNWKAQVFWSHRSWESTIVDQRPDERIIWHSKGQKGHVDGAVTFHELAPHLTRIVVVLEYHPQGMFERTGNIWRAQGRRVRLELKHFARHAMINSVLKADEIEGWRGVIEDSEVVLDHEEALEQERDREQAEGPDEGEDSRAGEDTARGPADEAESAGDEDAEEPDEAPQAQADEAESADDEEPDEADSAHEAEKDTARARRGRRRPAAKAAHDGDEAAQAPAAKGDDTEADDRADGDRRRRMVPAQASRSHRRPGADQPQRRTPSAARGENRK
jgi:Polyketide cyclase / dehydrase and lipid transport